MKNTMLIKKDCEFPVVSTIRVTENGEKIRRTFKIVANSFVRAKHIFRTKFATQGWKIDKESPLFMNDRRLHTV